MINNGSVCIGHTPWMLRWCVYIISKIQHLEAALSVHTFQEQVTDLRCQNHIFRLILFLFNKKNICLWSLHVCGRGDEM